MPARHHRLFSTITLSLAATIGLAACDAAPDAVPVERDASLHETSIGSCLTDTSVTLMHDDGTVDVSPDIGAGLAEYARPNDIVEVAFNATNECLDAHGPRLSLVVATQHIVSEGQGYGLLWDVDTAKFAAGAGTLAVRLPDCAYRIALAFGEPRTESEAEVDERSIVGSGADKTSCADVPVLAVRRFEVVRSGESAELTWEIDADPKAELTVEIDADADGQADHVNNQCPECGEAGFVIDECPDCLQGNERPELLVSDGVRRVWAAATVLE